jgi:hypothetical protein
LASVIIATTSMNVVTTSSNTIITRHSMELVALIVVMLAITWNFQVRFGDFIST